MVSLVNFRQFGEMAEGEHLASGVVLSPSRLSAEQNNAYFQNPPTFGTPKSQIVDFGQKAKLGSEMAPKEHFEIRWTNLSYQVEPKWYQRLLGSGGDSGAGSSGGGGSVASGAGSLSDSSAASSSSSVLASSNSNAGPNNRRNLRRANILNGLNGSVKSGQVTAILGPSGAGKTSLLGCLTGKNKAGVTGSVEVISTNGGPGPLDPLSVCTIPQKDFLLNQLSVRENLWFASRLKHPESPFDHDLNINRVVDLLKLDTCIDTKISKISGGQYKRVSIAQELLSNPDILILDEPTSGLDSLTCYKTVMVLRDLARLSPNPMAIIVTIHQPQREVFDLFNHVYILAVGGRCIYEGEPAHSIRTINESGAGLSFDSNMYNPASYLVEIASSEFGEKPIEVLVSHQYQQFKQRTQAQDKRNLVHTLDADGNQQPEGASGGVATSKRFGQSPMIARLKSTLSSFSGSPKPVQHQRHLQVSNATSHVGYTNEAFASSLTLNEIQPQQQNQTFPNNNNNARPPLPNAASPPTHHPAQNQQASLSHNQTSSESGNAQPAVKSGQNVLELVGDYVEMDIVDDDQFYLDSRLQTHKHNHKGHFMRHCMLLTKRSWLCLCKDPMLTTLRFSAHIVVPLLITIVYGARVGKPNACPLYESNMDLIDYARRGAKRLLNLQDELRCTFENVGLYFLSIYAFTFSTMCLTSLSFPLNMHVLLKEVRNGWYSIPTYFIGKTLADFPLEFILPTLTLMITYPLTGQPSSYLEWRFLLATGVFVVTSLIAQTQGLIFGALFMNAMQAAVFVAPVSTTPLILLSGFLIRISQMPMYLQRLSSLSYFRYAIESLTIIRYGFGQCECDPSIVNGEPVRATGVPDQLRTMTNYWLSTFNDAQGGANDAYSLTNDLNETISDIVTTTTTASGLVASANSTGDQQIDFFQDLTVLLARANSFGADIKTCADLKPYPMIDFSLEDSQLYTWLAALMATLVISKVANYIVVKYSVKWRL